MYPYSGPQQPHPQPPPYSRYDPASRPTPPPIPARVSSDPPTPRLPARPRSLNQGPALPSRPKYKSEGVCPPLPSRPPKGRSTQSDVDTITRAIAAVTVSSNNNEDIFNQPISTSDPSCIFPRSEHEVRVPIHYENGQWAPTETNKFYGNMLLGDGTNPIWTHPYSLWFSKEAQFPGLCVAHVNSSERVFGASNPPQYFFSPIGIKSLVFSAIDFNGPDGMVLETRAAKHMSIQALLKKSNKQYIWFPLVQGMGFVTAVYYNLVPIIESGIGFRKLEAAQSPKLGILKYRATLENNTVWTLYLTVPNEQSVGLTLRDGHTIVATTMCYNCVFQVVADTVIEIDSAAGCYPYDCQLSGSTEDILGKYEFSYTTNGESLSSETLLYALPHHVETLTEECRRRRIPSQLESTVKGTMVGFITSKFQFSVVIPSALAFDPFSTIESGKEASYTADILATIHQAAILEVQQDVFSESNLDSMYFAGKIVAKYAWILYCCQYLLKDKSLAKGLLNKLKVSLNRFISNKQILPLKYDGSWGGIVSSGTNSQDFGNSYYNDHHFHYSYHVVAAAIVAKVDQDLDCGSWLDENKEWVEALIRDYANPSDQDPYFPVFRSFDWFNGHSWAKGLFESGDGKDQESSSEDANASYALKLWALVTNNSKLRSVADLQLGIMRGSFNSYFLYADDNKVMPRQFIPNKVSGILFENKIDHTTYFGNELQYIQMIHAIPITPSSSFIRTPVFVKEEWEQKLSGIVDSIEDGWKGIIMLNVALFNPAMSYFFFSGSNFDRKFLDPGQSLTWSLAYSGAFL